MNDGWESGSFRLKRELQVVIAGPFRRQSGKSSLADRAPGSQRAR